MFLALITPKPKDLTRGTVAHIIGLKVAGHTTREICELTGARPTSVKAFVRHSRRERAKIRQSPNITLGGQGRPPKGQQSYSSAQKRILHRSLLEN